MKHAYVTQRGFTLTEILVVIAIIGILASVVLAGTSSSRAAARDNQRVADVRNVQLAFEQYRQACGGRYPAQEGADAGSSDDVLLEGDLGGMDPSAFNAGCSGGTSLASFLKVFPTYPSQAEGLHATPKAYAAVGLPVDDYKVGMNDERHYIIRAKLETPHKALSETDEVDTLFISEDGTEIDCDDDAHYFCVGN